MRRLLALLPALVVLHGACGASDDRAPFAPSASAGPDAGPLGDGSPVPSGSEAGASCTGMEGGMECAKLKLAFTRFYLGDTDRGGKPLSYAWEYFGEDYDGLHSSYSLNGECKPVEGEPPYAALDGINGHDNEFGRRVLPLLEPWDPTPSKASDEALKAGVRRPIIILGQLGGGLTGAKLRAFFTYLLDGQTEPELARYEAATFENGTFDSGPSTAPLTLELPLGTQVMRVVVFRLRVRFDLSPDGKAIGGQLSGAIKVPDLQAAVRDHVGRTAPEECGGAKLEDLKKTLAKLPDVLAAGGQDGAATCDAVSFGVGFEAEPVVVTGPRSYPAALTPGCP